MYLINQAKPGIFFTLLGHLRGSSISETHEENYTELKDAKLEKKFSNCPGVLSSWRETADARAVLFLSHIK